MNSPIFIVGCPRSGTQLLRNMLRSHPNLSFGGETHFIPKFYRAFGDPRNEREAERLASLILGLQWIRIWELPLKPESFSHSRSYANIVERIFQAWAQKENKPRWGDKTPQYVMNMPLLLELFPGARFIHIIRDGRDVAMSWQRRHFGPANIFTAAKKWKHFVITGQESAGNLPMDSYLEIRYEALLEQPGKVLKQVCLFIDELFHEEMLTPDPLILDNTPGERLFGKSRTSTNLALSRHIEASNTFKWKTQMHYSDQVIFESVAGDLLESLGYKTLGTRRNISGIEQKYWQLHHLASWWMRGLNSRSRLQWIKTDLLLRWAEFQSPGKQPQD